MDSEAAAASSAVGTILLNWPKHKMIATFLNIEPMVVVQHTAMMPLHKILHWANPLFGLDGTATQRKQIRRPHHAQCQCLEPLLNHIYYTRLAARHDVGSLR